MARTGPISTPRRPAIEAGVRAGQRVARPFMFQAVSESPADLQACSRIWARDMYPEVADAPRHARAARKDRQKIRIGYVSGEFREQATADPDGRDSMRPMTAARFEIIAVDNGRNDGSAMRGRLEKAFDSWIDISALSDEEAAAAIRAEEIDILVNLNGYFGKPRMGVFARRPAPIQVNYLGFPATLGAPYIDYILADQIVIPQDEQRFYDEKVVTLPGSYQVNDNKGRAIARNAQPRRSRIAGDGFRLLQFQQAYKLTPDTFAGWMRILKQVDGSVLWLLESQAPFAQNVRRAAARPWRGSGARSCSRPTCPRPSIWRGWPGRPVPGQPALQCPHHRQRCAVGRRAAADAARHRLSRAASPPACCVAAGLPELVTENAEDYEALAVKLAKDAKLLDALRDKLTANRATVRLVRHRPVPPPHRSGLCTDVAALAGGRAAASFRRDGRRVIAIG